MLSGGRGGGVKLWKLACCSIKKCNFSFCKNIIDLKRSKMAQSRLIVFHVIYTPTFFGDMVLIFEILEYCKKKFEFLENTIYYIHCTGYLVQWRTQNMTPVGVFSPKAHFAFDIWSLIFILCCFGDELSCIHCWIINAIHTKTSSLILIFQVSYAIDIISLTTF